MVAKKQAAPGKRGSWVPDRQDIIWIDCNPQVGHEMRDVHLFLVLSPRIFNAKTSLVIGLPMTTAEYNADNPFAVAVGQSKGRKAGQTSYVLCHQPKSTGVCAEPNPTRSGHCPMPYLRRCASA